MLVQPTTGQTPTMIVMAEDDSGHATLIQRNMKRAGLTNLLVHLKDGQEVLDFLMKKGIHENRSHDGPIVLLLDIKMPRVDGVEVLRRLKENKSTVRIPVIMNKYHRRRARGPALLRARLRDVHHQACLLRGFRRGHSPSGSFAPGGAFPYRAREHLILAREQDQTP